MDHNTAVIPRYWYSHTGKMSSFSRLVFFICLAIMMLTGCSTTLPNVPPFQTDGKHHTGKIIWHDLITPDMEEAKNFYAALFGWSFEQISDSYTLISHDNQFIGGIAEHTRAGDSAYWVPLVSVPDIDHVAKEAANSSASVMLKPFNLPGRGRISVIRDPQGAVFGVIHSNLGDPEDHKAALNEWLWHEIWTSDPGTLAPFYEQLIGYSLGEYDADDFVYKYLKYQDTPRVGLIRKKNPEVQNTWVAYIRVADVTAMTEQVESLGGHILMPPDRNIRNGTVAIITDPFGAGLVIQEWNR